MSQERAYGVDDFVVYPSHGLAQIVAVEIREAAGQLTDWFVLRMKSSDMTIQLPASKAPKVGLRPVISQAEMDEALLALQVTGPETEDVKLPVSWARRSRSYADRINLGRPEELAQIIKELTRGSGDDPISPAAKGVYETALERLSQELAIVQGISVAEAVTRIELLAQSAPLSS